MCLGDGARGVVVGSLFSTRDSGRRCCALVADALPPRAQPPSPRRILSAARCCAFAPPKQVMGSTPCPSTSHGWPRH